MKAGDLVKTNIHAQASLREYAPVGFGCVTKVTSEKIDIVYVFWYKEGRTKPISRRWLKVLA